MGSRRELLLAGALLVAVVLLALLVSPAPERRGADPRLSSFHDAPEGALALYLLLEELTIPTARRLTPFVDADPLDGPLALLAPSQRLTPAELSALLEWVDAGGELLYVATPGDGVLEALGLALERIGEPGEGGATAAALRSPGALPGWVEPGSEVVGFRRAFADTSHAVVAGDASPLLATAENEVVALTLAIGAGRVQAWSDPQPLTNRALRESGAALLLARAAAEMTTMGGALHFDEYHHGYRGGGSPMAATLRFLRDTGAGRAALQLALVGAGLLLLLGRRFGAPYPPPPARRRSPLEHVEALARAYRQAGARTTARRLVLAGLARRLGRSAPAAGREADLLEQLASGLRGDSEPLRELLAEWRKGERADLLLLARQADRLVTETRSPVEQQRSETPGSAPT